MSRLTSQEQVVGDEKMEVKEWTLLLKKEMCLMDEVYGWNFQPHERRGKQGVQCSRDKPRALTSHYRRWITPEYLSRVRAQGPGFGEGETQLGKLGYLLVSLYWLVSRQGSE